MAATAASQAVLPVPQLTTTATDRCKYSTVSQSSFLGQKAKKTVPAALAAGNGKGRVVCEAQQTTRDKWSGLGRDISDDQQDITRGKGMVDALFQGAMGFNTQSAVLSSYDYVSQGQRNFNWDNMLDGFYIAPAYMDKVVVHLAKNFMNLPNVKVPLILGVWGGKGQGKSFQAELIFAKLGINPIMMSAGELESGNAGEPAKLIRQRYREASDVIKKGKMCCLFINDLDAGAGRMGGTTQYTVNNQMVNATLMNIADSPTNVQLPGVYNKEEIPRVPVIVTGNDFSTLYAPLIRDGRMEKFYWAPTREDRIGVCEGIFRPDGVDKDEVTLLVDTFPGQSIDFFGALRARVYDDQVRKWVAEVGVENIGKKLVNSREGPPKFEKPPMTLQKLLEYGHMLVKEQENVKRVQLADKYLEGAELGNANFDEFPEFLQEAVKKVASQSPTPPPRPAPSPTPARTPSYNATPSPSYSSGPSYGNGAVHGASNGSSNGGALNGSGNEIVPILPSSSSNIRGRGMLGRGRGGARRTVPRARGESGNGSYLSSFSDSESESSAVSLDEIVPIVAKNPAARGGRGKARGRAPTRSSRPAGDTNGSASYFSGSESGSEGYYSSSTKEEESYSSAVATALEDIIPIVAKNPASGRGRGRKRGLPRTGGRSGYSSGSASESESERSYSYSASTSTIEAPEVKYDDIVPIISKKPTAIRGRGGKRGLPRSRRSGSGSGSGSGSEGEGYYTDSGSFSDSGVTNEIVPIIAKNPPQLRGRGGILKKRGQPKGRRSTSQQPGSYSGSESEGEGYRSDSFSASATATDIVPIRSKSPVSVRGRGFLKKRGQPKTRRSGSGSGSGSGSESEGYYSDSSPTSAVMTSDNEIIPIVSKNPTQARGRGILKKRGLPRSRKSTSGSRSDNGAYSSGYSDSEGEGYYSDSTPAPATSLNDIVPIVAKSTGPAARKRGGGMLKRRSLRRSGSGSGSGYSSAGSDSEGEGYYSDSRSNSTYSAPEPEPEPEPVEITPIYAKNPAGRGATRGRGRGRAR